MFRWAMYPALLYTMMSATVHLLLGVGEFSLYQTDAVGWRLEIEPFFMVQKTWTCLFLSSLEIPVGPSEILNNAYIKDW